MMFSRGLPTWRALASLGHGSRGLASRGAVAAPAGAGEAHQRGAFRGRGFPQRALVAASFAAAAAAPFAAPRSSCEEQGNPQPSASSSEQRWIDDPQANDDGSCRGIELVAMIRAGNIQSILQKLETLPHVDTPLTKAGSTALAIACALGNLKLVNVLLKNGADPAKPDSDGVTCVMRACAEGHLSVLRRLYTTQRVDLQSGDRFGRAPIHHAVVGGHLDIVRYLLEGAGINPDVAIESSAVGARASRHETCLHLAANRLSMPVTIILKPPRYQAMEMLLFYGADPAVADAAGDTVLHLCARQGDLTGLFVLLAGAPQSAAALDARNASGDSVIDEADLFAVKHGLAVRAAKWMPSALRKWIADAVFSEFAAVMRSG